MAGEGVFRVVVAGGGVAALESVLALSTLAGRRTQVVLLAPNAEFAYRPLAVAEPFGYAPARRLAIADIAAAAGAELLVDRFAWVDAAGRTAHTDAGRALRYDALVLALGARSRAPFAHGVVIDDPRMNELLRGVLRDVEDGSARRLAFVTAARLGWPLPIYELALMTAHWARESALEVEVTVVTPERVPLEVFGEAASAAVDTLLTDAGIAVFTAADAHVPAPDRVVITPGDREVVADRLIVMPTLFGPAVRGLPAGEHGFIPVDAHCRAQGVEHIWAAGDATNFPVKQGGIGAQQADTAAQAIAALAGADLIPQRFRPEIRGILLTGGPPLYFTAHLSGGHAFESNVSRDPLWTPLTKIAADHLAPYLEHLAHTDTDT